MASKWKGIWPWSTIRASKDIEETVDVYNSWATIYEKDCTEFEYKGPELCAEVVDSLLEENKNALILDAGAGTGLFGEQIQKFGFRNLHALDGSQKMLDIANEKGIYKKSIRGLLGPNRLDINTDTYDCVACVGTMMANHANAGCLPELIRITKPGGYVVIATRECHIPDCDYNNKTLEEWLKIHEDNGHWTKIDIKRVEKYFRGVDAGIIFIYQAL